jgi:RNA polymerase sigma-70 factor, ECF subfamily
LPDIKRLYDKKLDILTDRKLIEECRSGNLANFRKLVEQTSPFAYSVAFRLLGDPEKASDIVQDTLVTIWHKLKKIKTADTYKTWVYRIVVNKCYDEMRRKKRNPEINTDENTWAFLSDRISGQQSDALEEDEIASVIRLLSENLSPRQKTIFILSEIEEMTGDEISEITGYGKSAIKANLYYARKNISEMLEKYLK